MDLNMPQPKATTKNLWIRAIPTVMNIVTTATGG